MTAADQVNGWPGNTRVNRAVVVLFLPIALTGCLSSDANKCRVDPEIFCAPYKELDAAMPDSAKEELLALPDQEHWKLHFSLGMSVRNRFDLWGDNELTRFFNDNGIDHPDGISEPFIDGYIAYLQGKPVAMKDMLGLHLPPPPPPELLGSE